MKLSAARIATVTALTAAGLGAVLLAGIGRPDSAHAEPAGAETGSGITVTGTGSVSSTPDRADFSFGVETEGATASEALDRNGPAVQTVIDALKAAGVAAADIQTQQVSVSPRYASDAGKIAGYTATNTVGATIRALGRAGTIVDAAVAAGANQVYGPSFAIADQARLYQDALGRALDDARSKAQTIAQAAGVSLGAVTRIVEGAQGGPPVPLAAGAAADSEATPIEPGRQPTEATLTVTFSIS